MSDANVSDPTQRNKSLIQQALGHLNRDSISDAETLLGTVLESEPDNADALQLLGLIRRQQRLHPEAEQFYRRSLAVNPQQPNVYLNLGNLYVAMGRTDEAIAAFREAVRLKPNYADAHLALGRVLHERFQYEEAEKSYRQALRIQPNYLMAKQRLGAVLTDQRKGKEAERLLKQAIVSCPPNDTRQIAALEHNLALAIKQQGRYEEALRLFDHAQSLVPEMPLVDYNRANTLQHLGRQEEAIHFYREAIARNPLDFLAHRDLNQLLYRMGRDDLFLESYAEAERLHPSVGLLHVGRGDFRFRVGDYNGALADLERAVREAPDSIPAHDGLAITLTHLGRFDEAIREHEIALKLEPENIGARGNFVITLLRAGDPERARREAEEIMRRNPEDQGGVALWGLTLKALNDEREQAINDFGALVQEFALSPPRGFSDMESFNHELNTYLDTLHRDKRGFVDQTLRGGTQTFDKLFGADHDLVERLRERIDEAVQTYIDRLKEDPRHPLLRRKLGAFEYSGSWSSRLRDCGFHSNHIHPQGWISSAYYVAVPEAVEDETARQGWIKFGEPSFAMPVGNLIRRAIKPRPGHLVLFPSYMWHGTYPFQSQQSRTTIAFDALPR